MLKFNIKEHDLKELEKYGFVNIFEYYSLQIKDCYIDIMKNELGVYIEDDDGNFRNDGYICDEILDVLHDLIKDGLVVKE